MIHTPNPIQHLSSLCACHLLYIKPYMLCMQTKAHSFDFVEEQRLAVYLMV